MATKITTNFDPRTKLILAVFYAAWVVAAGQVAWLTAAYGLLLVFFVVGKETEAYVRWLKLVAPMSLFFGAVIWLTVDFTSSVFAAFKLLTLTTVFFAFFSTTEPEDMANSLVKIGLPYAVAFVMSTSLQFVPVMGRKVRSILDAQRARGIPLEPGWAAIRNYPSFFGPVLIQAFQLAEELAEAMEARGFGRPGRTFLKAYEMRYRDWVVIGAGCVLLVTFFLLK
jgi:energy-coupling factor transport system permease protein